MVFLIFEGTDKTGKSTLISEVHKATQFKYPIIDRFSGSSVAYGKFRKRDLKYEQYFELEKYLFSKCILFYLTTSKENIEKRMIEKDEKDIKVEEIEEVKKCYEEYLKKTFFKYYIIDTSKSIDECVKEIVEIIKKEEEKNSFQQILDLIEIIKRNGSEINNTLEILDVNLEYKSFVVRDWCDYLEKLELNYADITIREKLFYDRILSSLKHIINSQLKEHSQSESSRRFIYTSQECIDSIHLLKRDNTLRVFVNIRSSDILKILPIDMYYLNRIVDGLNYEFFKCSKTQLQFHINSLHLYLDDKKRLENGNSSK